MKYLITLPAVLLSIVLLCLGRAGPANAQVAVDTTLGGLPLRTTVDSPLARDLILGQLTGHDNQFLTCQKNRLLPTSDHLRAISRRHSPDTAMALLVRCLLETPAVASAQSLFVNELGKSDAQLRDTAAFLRARNRLYAILLVPGWGYQAPDNPTGADLAMPRAVIEAQGFETHLAPLPGNGSVEQGARIVGEVLRRLLASGKRIIVVSASSGGPIVAHAIASEGIDAHPALRGWLNICGVLNGSPVIDRFMFWPGTIVLRAIAFFEGWEYNNLLSLSQRASRTRFRAFAPPPQLTIVNYIGTAFSGQVSPYARFFNRLLRSQGPNDGLTFITDALAPGYTILGIGTDHFIMEDPDIVRKTGALLPVLLQLIERD